MTARSRIQLFASTIIVAGGFMLLDAPPAAAAIFGTGCERMQKLMAEQSAACADAGGTYHFDGQCSSTSSSMILISWCE